MLWEISVTLKGMYFVVCLFKSRDIFLFERKEKIWRIVIHMYRQIQVDITCKRKVELYSMGHAA